MKKNYFPTNLRFLLKANGLTQDRLGELLGKKRSVIGSYVRAEAEPSISNLLSICEFFDINIYELIEEDLRLRELVPNYEQQAGANVGAQEIAKLEENLNKQVVTLFSMIGRLQDDFAALETKLSERVAAIESAS